MSRLIDALTEAGGIASREQLAAAGVRGPLISLAVRAGEVRRVRRAQYALPTASPGAIAAVRLGGRLGCVSAAKSYGLWHNTGPTVHVALPVNAARLRTNRMLVPSGEPLTADRSKMEVELHWSDVWVSARAAGEAAWRVPLERALAQVARCAPRVDAIAVFESAVRTRQLDIAAAQKLLDASAPGRLGPARIRGHDGSGAETYLAESLRELGLAFAQQVPFDGVGVVDFLVEGRLIVEVDGFGFHGDREAFGRDRARDATMLSRGIPTLRIPAAVVISDRHAAAQRVVDALIALAA
jgi:very-short-patch-repair endonuclease